MTITPAQAMAIVRVAIGSMMVIHGVTRIVIGGVAPFGGFLESQGFPAGVALAWGVTLIEVVGGPLLVAGRFVRALSLYFAAQLLLGIALVHFREGWFVVGAGRNGMEYSVLLIVAFGAVALASPGGRK
ncbi:MAG: DoxX family protein [Gemmatimonadales bacterium]|nr:DoxX family protein [Gemmatimonadales bacterium]